MSYAPFRRRTADASSARAAGVDRHDGPPRLEFILIVFRLVLGEPGPDEGTDEPGDARTGRRVREDDAQGAGRDGGADDGNHPRQDAEPGEGTQAQAGQGTGQGTRAGMRIVPRIGGITDAFGVSHGDPNLGLGESRLVELGDGLIGVETVLEHADDCGALLSIHGQSNKQITFQIE